MLHALNCFCSLKVAKKWVGEGNILTLHDVHKWFKWIIFLIYFTSGIFATLVSNQSQEPWELCMNSTWALAKRPLPMGYRVDTFPTIPLTAHVPVTSLMSPLHCLRCLLLSGKTESPAAFWPCPASASDFYPTLLLTTDVMIKSRKVQMQHYNKNTLSSPAGVQQ